MEITAEQLKQKIEIGETIMVAFTASWCGPCRVYKPTYQKLSESSEIPMYMYGVDSGDNSGYAVELGIRAVPTTKLFSDGVEKYTKSGIVSETELKSVISGTING